MKNFNLFIPITKIDVVQRLVYGLATAEQVDKSGEIFDYETSLPYYKEWSGEIEKASGGKSLGNVREMHTNIAAGKLTQINFNDELKQIEVCAKIVNQSTWEKVEEGVLTGFSHGGEYINTWTDPDNKKFTRYTARPAELSVVDNPCLGSATFMAVKADGSTEMRKFKTKEPVMTKNVDDNGKPAQPKYVPVQKWEASDGKTFAKKEDWRLHELSLETAVDIDPALKALAELTKALDDKEVVDPMTLNKKEFSDDKRKELADSGKAMPDGSFPIENVQDLKNAIRAHGRAADPEAAKAHIIARAKELGATSELPDGWDGKKDAEKALTGKVQELLALVKGGEAYDAKLAIEALCIIECLICGEEFEAMWGEDGDVQQVADLKSAVSSLKSFISSEIMEDEDEGMELPMAMANKIKDLAKAAITSDAINDQFVKQFDEMIKIDPLAKAGARHSGADKEQLGKAKDGLDDAKGHMEDAHTSHDKLGKAHGEMRDTMDKMADCMKSVIVNMKKAEPESDMPAKLSDHMDKLDGAMDKAEKHHGKMAKSHDAVDAAHDVVGHALKAVGAAGDEAGYTSEKNVSVDLKKSQDALATLQEQLAQKDEEINLVKVDNTKMQKTLDEVLTQIPVLTERLKKVESQPLPGKGVLYDTTGHGGPLAKGHENPTPAADSDETRTTMTQGASPEQMREIMNIRY